MSENHSDDTPPSAAHPDEEFLLPPNEEDSAHPAPEGGKRPLRRRPWFVALMVLTGLGILGAGAAGAWVWSLASELPRLESMGDYRPQVVSRVYDAEGKKVWEYFKEYRIVVPAEKIPEHVREAFIAAEDASFYDHGGIDFVGIVRAAIRNALAGGIKQGASTITQQVARTFFLSSERKYSRKIKEMILARRLESRLSKDEILYLYLNQIYLGSGAYGVAAAADIYFHKTLDELTLAEAATIAGVTPRPADYAPNVNPHLARRRQLYVLNQMLANGFITREEHDAAVAEGVRAHERKLPIDRWPHMAYPMEDLRQELVARFGEDLLFHGGLYVVTSLVESEQKIATEAVRVGVEHLDREMGYRGPLRRIEGDRERRAWIEAAEAEARTRVESDDSEAEEGILVADTEAAGKSEPAEEAPAQAPMKPAFKTGEIYEALVLGFAKLERTDADPEPAAVVALSETQLGTIALSSMAWARKPNPDLKPEDSRIEHPREALGPGDVIRVKVLSAGPGELDKSVLKSITLPPGIEAEVTEEPEAAKAESAGKKAAVLAAGTEDGSAPPATEEPAPVPLPVFHYELALWQEPEVQGALLSLNPRSGQIHAMVGGYDFLESEFNRAVQGLRQPGSAFKPVIFSRALREGFTASTTILDAPVTYKGATDDETWKPKNYVDRFSGEVTLREALYRSINTIPIKILLDIGIKNTIEYAHELGIEGDLPSDPTLALGSASLSLMDLCRAYSVFANGGYRIESALLQQVLNAGGTVIYEWRDPWGAAKLPELPESAPSTMRRVIRVPEELAAREAGGTMAFGPLGPKAGGSVDGLSRAERARRIQAISPQAREAGQVLAPATAYVMTDLLSNVISYGTGHSVASLGRPAAGKTGTSNENVDAWFIGYTPSVLTGVWMGFDDRTSLGRFHAGGNTAAPVWLDFMREALRGKPVERFDVPEGVVFAKIDAETGLLARPGAERIAFQAYVEGTEPTEYVPQDSEVSAEEFFLLDQSLQEAPAERPAAGEDGGSLDSEMLGLP